MTFTRSSKPLPSAICHLSLSLLFSSILSFFFSHPDSCLKISILIRKSDVFGGDLGGPRRGKIKNMEKLKKRKNENKIFEKKNNEKKENAKMKKIRKP